MRQPILLILCMLEAGLTFSGSIPGGMILGPAESHLQQKMLSDFSNFSGNCKLCSAMQITAFASKNGSSKCETLQTTKAELSVKALRKKRHL